MQVYFPAEKRLYCSLHRPAHQAVLVIVPRLQSVEAIVDGLETATPKVTPQVTPQVIRLLSAMDGEMDRGQIQLALGLKDRKNFRLAYLAPALEAGLIEMTQPDTPSSPTQKYRLTLKGKQLREHAAS